MIHIWLKISPSCFQGYTLKCFYKRFRLLHFFKCKKSEHTCTHRHMRFKTMSYLINPPWKKKKDNTYKILMTWGSILLLSPSLLDRLKKLQSTELPNPKKSLENSTGTHCLAEWSKPVWVNFCLLPPHLYRLENPPQCPPVRRQWE